MDRTEESRFEAHELSMVVAAAANNQGDSNLENESSTQVIEDLSLIRKLSIELNKNYEKF